MTSTNIRHNPKSFTKSSSYDQLKAMTKQKREEGFLMLQKVQVAILSLLIHVHRCKILRMRERIRKLKVGIILINIFGWNKEDY